MASWLSASVGPLECAFSPSLLQQVYVLDKNVLPVQLECYSLHLHIQVIESAAATIFCAAFLFLMSSILSATHMGRRHVSTYPATPPPQAEGRNALERSGYPRLALVDNSGFRHHYYSPFR